MKHFEPIQRRIIYIQVNKITHDPVFFVSYENAQRKGSAINLMKNTELNSLLIVKICQNFSTLWKMVKGYYFIVILEILNKKFKLNRIIHHIWKKKRAKNTAVLVYASSKWILVKRNQKP